MTSGLDSQGKGKTLADTTQANLSNGFWGNGQHESVQRRSAKKRERPTRSARLGEAEMHAIVENSSHAILVIQGYPPRIVYSNPAAEQVWGYRSKELLTFSSKQIVGLVADDDAVKDLSREYQALLNGEEQGSPWRICTRQKDGSLCWAEVYVRALQFKGKRSALATLVDITDRIRAEEALQQRNRYLALIRETIPDVIWSTDMNLITTDVSPRISELLGYGLAEGKRLSWQDAVTPASFKHALAAYSRVLKAFEAKDTQLQQQLTKQSLELEMRKKDGSTVWVESKVSLLQSPDGQLEGFVGVSRDITDRRKARQQLKASQDYVWELLRNSPSPVLVIQANGTISYVNPALERLTGYRLGELLERTAPYPWWPEEMKEVIGDQLRESRLKGVQGLEQEYESRERKRFRVEVNFTRVTAEDRPEYFVETWFDITERTLPQKRLGHLERTVDEHCRLLAGNVQDFIILTDLGLRPTLINAAVVPLLGFSIEEAMAHGLRDIMLPASVKAIEKMLRQRIRGASSNEAGAPWTFTKRIGWRRKDGEQVCRKATVSALLGPDGHPTELLIVVHHASYRRWASSDSHPSHKGPGREGNPSA